MQVSTPYRARVTSDNQHPVEMTVRVSTKDESGGELAVAHLAIPGPLRSTCLSHGWRIVALSEPSSDDQLLLAEPVDWAEILAHVQAELQQARDELAALNKARHRLVVDAQQSGTTLAVAGEAMGLTRMRISQIRRRQ